MRIWTTRAICRGSYATDFAARSTPTRRPSSCATFCSPIPPYTSEDVAPVLKALHEIPRAAPFTISPQFTVRPHDAGHILGSSSLELTITENGKKIVVLFSGDVGRYSQQILKNPEAPPRCDVLLCESTYGDRDHPGDSPEDALADVVNRVVKRG